MEFHTCKPALIISPKCEISGVNPGLFSHEFSEKVCSSENSAGTLQTPHWSPRLALGKAETMSLKGLIATDLSLRMFYWYQVPKTLMRQTSQKQMKLILLLLSLLKCSETQWCLWCPWEHTGGFPGCSSQQDVWVHRWGHSIRDKPCGLRGPSV